MTNEDNEQHFFTSRVPAGLDRGDFVQVGDDPDVVICPAWSMKSVYHPSSYVELQLRMVGATPVCTEVRFFARDPDRGVAAEAVRDFRLADWVEHACVQMAIKFDRTTRQWDLDLPDGAAVVPAVRRARAAVRGGYTNELLQEVARIYEANNDGRPTRAVREAFRVAQSTAQLYVRKARDAGVLTAAPPKSRAAGVRPGGSGGEAARQ